MSALDTALHALRSLIADGALLPGDRLPSEDELAQRLGVSRGSIREAIRMFAALGVVETRHGSGSYVGQLHAADLISSLSLTVGLLPFAAVLELYEMRRALESHAAALAAARIDAKTLSELDQLLTELENSQDPDVQAELDHLFHLRIAEASGNRALASMVSVFRSRSRFYNLFLSESAAQIKLDSDAGHRAILRGLAARDSVVAAAAATDHIARSEHWLRFAHPSLAAGSGSVNPPL